MSMVTGPSASSAARSAGSRPASGRSPPPGRLRRRCQCPAVNRRASPVAVEVASPGTGVTCCPAASARSRSRPDQEVLPGQLRRGHPGQHLPAGKPALPLLDRPHRLIQGLDQAELAAQLGDREHPARRRQRRIRRAGPHLLTPPATSTYPAHQIGVLSTGLVVTWQRSSSQARAAPIGIYTGVSPAYSRNRGKRRDKPAWRRRWKSSTPKD